MQIASSWAAPTPGHGPPSALGRGPGRWQHRGAQVPVEAAQAPKLPRTSLGEDAVSDAPINPWRRWQRLSRAGTCPGPDACSHETQQDLEDPHHDSSESPAMGAIRYGSRRSLHCGCRRASGVGEGARQQLQRHALGGSEACSPVEDDLCDLVEVGLQEEVPAVEEFDTGCGGVLAERRRAVRSEDLVVLAPHGEHRYP